MTESSTSRNCPWFSLATWQTTIAPTTSQEGKSGGTARLWNSSTQAGGRRRLSGVLTSSSKLFAPLSLLTSGRPRPIGVHPRIGRTSPKRQDHPIVRNGDGGGRLCFED